MWQGAAGEGKVGGSCPSGGLCREPDAKPQGKESLPSQNGGHDCVLFNGTRVLTSGRVWSRPDRGPYQIFYEIIEPLNGDYQRPLARIDPSTRDAR